MSSHTEDKMAQRPHTPYDFNLLATKRYEDAFADKPPRHASIAYFTEPSPPDPNSNDPAVAPDLTRNSGPDTTYLPADSQGSNSLKRDSGHSPSDKTDERRPSFSASSDQDSPVVYQKPIVPAIVVQNETPPPRRGSRSPFSRRRKKRDSSTPSPQQRQPGLHHRIKSFHGMSVDIPSGGLDELMAPEFSNRGSMMLGGEKMDKLLAQEAEAVKREEEQKPGGLRSGRRKPSVQMLQAAIQRGRVLSAEEMTFSIRVRSMYDHGDEDAADWSTPPTNGHRRALSPETEPPSIDRSLQSPDPESEELQVDKTRKNESNGSLRPFSPASTRMSYIARDPHEVAGGIEDWQDIGGRDVDRYGFISPIRVASKDSTNASSQTTIRPGLPRVSTSIQLLSSKPRRKKTLRKAPSSRSMPARSRDNHSIRARGSLYSFRSDSSSIFETSPFRSKNRRLMNEASDMLTLPPGLADIAEQEDGGRTASILKKREWSREEKWQKMARVVNRGGARGGGMSFDFDTRDPRLIARTWKGIPDRWRATAWHSFLSASAKRRGGCLLDDELIARFHELQEEHSADDVQIDVDVPRTIGMHIMFRRRYRGGQRLLFRVLHAISIHYPDTGYVQGMASLAATLLCYYDEEHAFIMLARLWQLRGLEVLFRSGFDGLMSALSQFENEWLGQGAVAMKLKDLGIDCTAYGTRWYLTLFNMSIPFPAQLRVWDVFMLLGDELGFPRAHADGKTETFGGADLDVLHATSAALIDATRDIIVDSDFENAMKVLTSWVPIKDEDLLMRVAKAEYKAKKKRSKA